MIFSKDTKSKKNPLAQEIVERRRIDFGNYDDSKDAFSKDYVIKIPEDLGINSLVIQSRTRYRHE